MTAHNLRPEGLDAYQYHNSLAKPGVERKKVPQPHIPFLFFIQFLQTESHDTNFLERSNPDQPLRAILNSARDFTAAIPSAITPGALRRRLSLPALASKATTSSSPFVIPAEVQEEVQELRHHPPLTIEAGVATTTTNPFNSARAFGGNPTSAVSFPTQAACSLCGVPNSAWVDWQAEKTRIAKKRDEMARKKIESEKGLKEAEEKVKKSEERTRVLENEKAAWEEREKLLRIVVKASDAALDGIASEREGVRSEREAIKREREAVAVLEAEWEAPLYYKEQELQATIESAGIMMDDAYLPQGH
ncbi:hypothetical protein BJ508DRAFT_339291 [Ascobolus immersus RN42]|uniref:Uncharacterized protein n=1 Tax=Ascobolus immersus RN42 TaxID=1160509 RepID=A0A3N4HMQ7_ASCIM|nr:hypothetical protein BJ508DRAFT_339291 [Ascobolus immersus RN42]